MYTNQMSEDVEHEPMTLADAILPRRPRYVGTVTMGPSYAAPYAATDAYVWDTLDEVESTVRSATAGSGVRARVAEWDDDGAARAGHFDDSGTPCADEVTVWFTDNTPGALEFLERDGGLARRAFLGPRGGFHVED